MKLSYDELWDSLSRICPLKAQIEKAYGTYALIREGGLDLAKQEFSNDEVKDAIAILKSIGYQDSDLICRDDDPKRIPRQRSDAELNQAGSWGELYGMDFDCP